MPTRRSRLADLLSTGRIGPMVTRNRVVMPAMDQNLCDDDGLLTEANIGHYVQRARGGVGLLIVETGAVAYPVGATSRHQPNLATDDAIAGFAELADRVHVHGAKVIAQLCHHGKTAGTDIVEERPLLVPSLPLPPMNPMGMVEGLTIDEMMRMGARMQGKRPTHAEATTDDLAAVVDAFAASAARLERAGCDGVEVHAAHGYLLSTFLSPFWNRRDDEYGCDVAGRARLLREVVEAIGAATSDRFAVVVRIDGAEFDVEGGITPLLAARHAAIAEAAGAHAIHVSAMGRPDSGVSFSEGPLPWLPEQYVGLADAVKAAVSVPVIAVGRIDADHGDALIATGRADFVSMGRQLLADPDTVARLEAGRPDLVRPCINCNTCVAENFWDATPVCAVNARLGRHHELDLPAAERARTVVVVGGGPAGMEAARVAALRGHRVTLLEASPRLGGTARFSALTTPVNGRLVDHLDAAVREAGVDVRLGTPATPELLATLAPDAIVVATGARRKRPDVPGADLPHVLSGDDLRAMLTGERHAAPGEATSNGGTGDAATGDGATVTGATGDGGGSGLPAAARLALAVGNRTGLTSRAGLVRRASQVWMPIGNRVVVVGGSLVGVELAEFLAERGRTVTVFEPGRVAGLGMAHPRRWRALHQARSHGVAFVTDSELVEITPTDVAYRLPAGNEGDSSSSDNDGADETSGEVVRVDADTVIVASGVHPDPALAEQLRADESIAAEIHVVGDAADVDYIVGATRSAHDLALTL